MSILYKESLYQVGRKMVLKTWLPVPEDHPFSIENLPFGIFSTKANVGPLQPKHCLMPSYLQLKKSIPSLLLVRASPSAILSSTSRPW